jgi:MFS family permease
MAGFTVASMACGLAWDPASIIVARLLQGSFGALLIPQGFGILGSVFPRDQIAKAFSAFGPVMGLSAVAGPLLAGVLIDANLFGLGWRAMFLINIGLGTVGVIAGYRRSPATPAMPPSPSTGPAPPCSEAPCSAFCTD